MFKFPNFSSSLHRVFRNFAANALGQAMNGVYQIVTIPLFLHCWGKQEYGEWIVLFSIPSIVWSLEGGLSGIANNRMTVASAADNWKRVNSIFQNVFLVQAILTVTVLILTLVVVSTISLQHHLNFSKLSGTETSVVLVLLIGYMLASFYNSLFRAGYRTVALEHRGVMANNLSRFTDFFFTAVILLCHGSPILLAEAIFVNAFLWTLLLYLDIRRVSPKLEFGIRYASLADSKEIIKDGFPLLAGQACMAVFLQGYPLIINRALGASAVTSFVTIRTISRTLLLMNQVICYSSTPELARSYGCQDWVTYLRLLKVMLSSSVVTGLLTILGLSLLGPWIIALWTSGKITIDHLSMILFSISIALQGICGVGSLVLVCSNMHHLYNYLYLAITLLVLSLAYVVIPIFGFPAIPGSMVVQDLALTILLGFLFRMKITHISLGDLAAIFSPSLYVEKLRSFLKN